MDNGNGTMVGNSSSGMESHRHHGQHPKDAELPLF
jgi:hypothetical protein